MADKVVISGVGIQLPRALGAADFGRLLREGRMRENPSDGSCVIRAPQTAAERLQAMSEIEGLLPGTVLPRRCSRQLGLALLAASEAVQKAGAEVRLPLTAGRSTLREKDRPATSSGDSTKPSPGNLPLCAQATCSQSGQRTWRPALQNWSAPQGKRWWLVVRRPREAVDLSQLPEPSNRVRVMRHSWSAAVIILTLPPSKHSSMSVQQELRGLRASRWMPSSTGWF